MSASDILYGLIEERGWTVDTQLYLALEYIDNQQSDDAFADFLAQVIKDEDMTMEVSGTVG